MGSFRMVSQARIYIYTYIYITMHLRPAPPFSLPFLGLGTFSGYLRWGYVLIRSPSLLTMANYSKGVIRGLNYEEDGMAQLG